MTLKYWAWEGALPSVFSPSDFHSDPVLKAMAILLGAPPDAFMPPPSLPAFCPLSITFPCAACTSSSPDRWDSQTVWHMQRDTVKHKKQEVTQYLTSVQLACNIQEGSFPVTVLSFKWCPLHLVL